MGVSDYEKRLKHRLSKYGFTRPFQLESDLSRQDGVTTWIEYLAYEYWFYDQKASYVKRFQRKHDEAWKKLVDSGVLRPGESYDIVCNIDSVFKDAAEEEAAERAVQSATTAFLAAEKDFGESWVDNNFRQASRIRLVASKAAVEKAKAAYKPLKRRGDTITDFCQQIKGYRNAHKDAEHHTYLLSWIQQQIPTIERESKCMTGDRVDAGCVANGEPSAVTMAKDCKGLHHLEMQSPANGGSAVLPMGKAPAGLAVQQHREGKRSRCESIDVHRRFKRSRITSQGALDAVEGTINIGA
ncbi:hypothetical protein B0A55_13409 [Friedmanniomyces simplex]|uniref:Uncharacterized protein n=1 Tax=Friedmanniomyces simplex TaxID=329884 RepID=A0A4U0V5C8_9PEZI|nr:hypothetical protein B0A55_13409 [Friedmanniomyces simplex]